MIWITMLTLQIGNPGNMGVMSCFGQGIVHALNALVSVLGLVNLSCPEEHDIAFQNFRMLQGLGASLAFFLGGFVCVAVKLYIIISLLVLATLFYVVVEYHLKRAESGNSDMD